MKVLLVVIGILILGALLWGGGEMHYRNCVNAAVSTHPLTHARADDFDPQDLKYSRSLLRRRKAVAGCSRLP